MENSKKPNIRRNVLRKLNADNLLLIERGLLGDIPNKLKPQPLIPTRDQYTELEVAKPSGILSACIGVYPESPVSEKIFLSSSDEESMSPLKKTFSFRDRLSSFFGKDKDRPKSNIPENEEKEVSKGIQDVKPEHLFNSKIESKKSNKRLWIFKSKDLGKRKENSPIYKRSKSFEFLPRAITEEDEELSPGLKKNSSFHGSSDTMGDAWTSNESLEYISNVYRDTEGGVFLKSFKELACDDSHESSQVSTGSTWTSASSSNCNTENLLKTASVQNVFEEFHKAVELFSENYLSDCEPYTKSKQLTIEQKRKSSSFSILPSPKVVQASKVSEISEDFKAELSKVLSGKRDVRTSRRGSVTDWFVLEDHKDRKEYKSEVNPYKRRQKKTVNRVRRMSSTKYDK